MNGLYFLDYSDGVHEYSDGHTMGEPIEIHALNLPIDASAIVAARAEFVSSFFDDMARIFEIPGRSKLSKAALRNAIAARWADSDSLPKLLRWQTPQSRALFYKVVAGDKVTLDDLNHADFRLLNSMGLMYLFETDDELSVVVPQEIAHAARNIDASRHADMMEEYTRLVLLLKACANYYGIISYIEIANLYNTFFNTELTVGAFIKMYIKVPWQAVEVLELGDSYLMHKSIHYYDLDLPDLMFNHITKPQNTPPKDVLLSYANPKFFEPTRHTANLQKVLRDILREMRQAGEYIDDISAHSLTALCITYSRRKLPLEMLIENCDIFGVWIPDSKHFMRFMEAYTSMHNNNPLWWNNGFTATQLALPEDNFEPEPEQTADITSIFSRMLGTPNN